MLIVHRFFILCLLILGCTAASAQVFPYFPIVGHPAYSCGQVNSVTDCTVAAGPPAITGIETLLLDTNLAGGAQPQTVLSTVDTLKTYINSGVLTTIINGSTSTSGFTNGQCLTSVSGVVVGGSCGGVSTSLVVGTTTITGSCTTGFNLYNNTGILGCQANGGGGGSTGVATIAAMQALTATANAIAVLTDPVRHGTFAFNTTNHSVDVTNDPGQGITVAPGSDLTGASGAWIRQYNGPVDWIWWGAVPDGITTDPWGITTGLSHFVSGTISDQAFHDWNVWAIHQTALGNGVAVQPTCGQYNYNTLYNSSNSGDYWLSGITPLTINGNHCVTIQNATGTGASATQVTFTISDGAGGAGNILSVTGLTGRISVGAAPLGQEVFGGAFTPVAAGTYVDSQTSSTAAGGALGYTGLYHVTGAPQHVIVSGADGKVLTTFSGTTSGGVLTATNIHGPMFTGQLMLDFTSTLAANTYLQKDLGGGQFSISGNQTISSPDFMVLYSGLFAALPFPFLNSLGVFNGYLINQTAVGDFKFTISTPTDVGASGISVGDWVLLASLDTQYPGHDTNPNLEQFEYVQITSINAGTGAIGIDTSIRYQHMPTYPIAGQAGPAKMYTLGPTWNIDATLIGITVNYPPIAIAGNLNAVLLSGRFIHTVDYVGVGFAETNTAYVVHDNPILYTLGEMDKINQFVVYNNLVAPQFGLNLQSAGGAAMLTINGGIFNGIGGATKKLKLVGSKVSGSVIFQPSYGFVETVSLDSCEITATPFVGNITDGSVAGNIDGATVTYSSGTITVPLATLYTNPNIWNVVPGMHVNLEATTANLGAGTAGFSNNLGAGIVLSMEISAGSFLIHTNLPFSTMPTWATKNIYFFHTNEINVTNCTGSDVIRSMSAATAAGKRYFEYGRYMFAGISGASLNLPISRGCEVISVDVNVTAASQATTPTMVMTFPTVSKTPSGSSLPASPASGVILSIDLTTIGKRTFTQYAVSSGVPGTSKFLGSDSIDVGAGPSTSAWPSGIIMGTSEIAVAITVPATNSQSAYSEVIVNTDCGVVRTLVNPNKDQTAVTPATVIPTQGRLP